MTEKPVPRWKRTLVQGGFAGVFIGSGAPPIAIALATMGCILALCVPRRLALRFFAPYMESI